MSRLDLTQQATKIRRLATRHGVTRVRVFGSLAQGKADTGSDLDLLVDMASDRDLLDLIAFKLDVEEVLGCPVDVLTEAALSPYLRHSVLAEARPL